MTRPWNAALILLCLCAMGIAEPGIPPSNHQEKQLFYAVNHERQAQGLPALRWNDALASAARQHASQMAAQRSVEHTLPGEPSLPGRATRAGVRFGWISENIVSANDGSAAHTAFMHSPTHRANILDSDMDSVGIGVVERGGALYVVEDFCKHK